jgi:hypothetical protein
MKSSVSIYFIIYYQKDLINILTNKLPTIVNLHAAKEEGNIPPLYDYDMTQNREKDIRFHDRTDYDIKLAQDISDYHDFVGNSKEEGRRDI